MIDNPTPEVVEETGEVSNREARIDTCTNFKSVI